MPTENRSSNTEMVSVPFEREERYIVIKVSDLASVPVAVGEPFAEQLTAIQRRLPKRECLVIESDWPEYAPTWAAIERRVTGAPAPQPHPGPIAWMVGTAFWWTKEEAERDAAETGLPIVGLGPMVGPTPVERHLDEPVDVEGATFMGEPHFQHSFEWYREGISKHWKKICDLRAEVERLSAALRFYADREHFHLESGNWDTVSGEPLNILWCGEEPDFIEDGTVARNALFASAEPSALPDPLGCNECTHAECGRFDGPRQVECRAMADNACARPGASS